jgi:Zn-dependent protease
MILNFQEIFDIIVMSLAVGYIFSGFFRKYFHKQYENYDPLARKPGNFDWDSLKFAALSVAPAIILHEFAHKFVAIAFGLEAVFKAAYFWLFIGLMMKMMGTGFIFFVPAYVNISNPTGLGIIPFSYAMVAFAGPAMNGILWLLTSLVLKYNLVNRKYFPLLNVTKRVNMFLFIFNMLPLPGFDGFKVFQGIFQTIF